VAERRWLRRWIAPQAAAAAVPIERPPTVEEVIGELGPGRSIRAARVDAVETI